jgi:hypothetical protein
MPMYEVTHKDYDGDTDITDAHVHWVLAYDMQTVVALAERYGASVTEMDMTPEQCLPNVDFVLPRESSYLRQALMKEITPG